MRLIYLGPDDMVPVVRAAFPPDWEIVHANDDAAVDAALPSATAILDAYMRVRFPAARLARAAALRVFVTATTGADHVDQAALDARKIPLLTLKGQQEFLKFITPAAEHSWLLLMACARGLRAATHDVENSLWDRNRHPGMMLRGRTLGVVGCGRIGQWMSRYAAAFGMAVLGFDPHVSPWPEGIERRGLDDLLAQSDFVSVHVTLSDDTRNLLGRERLSKMKPGSVLVNTSRGEIVDQEALLDGLKSGRIRAAGLDVLTGEPEIAGHPLVEYAKTHDHLILTPHIGGFSPDALGKVLAFSAARVLAALAGEGR